MSMEQHEIALMLANGVRFEQARIAREVAALPMPEGRERVARLLTQPTEAVSRMKLGYLLRSIHRHGPALTEKHLKRAGLSSSALNQRVGPRPGNGTLTERQRQALAEVLR